MNKFMFCQKWLTGLGMYLTVFGIVLAVFPQSALMDSVFNTLLLLAAAIPLVLARRNFIR